MKKIFLKLYLLLNSFLRPFFYLLKFIVFIGRKVVYNKIYFTTSMQNKVDIFGRSLVSLGKRTFIEKYVFISASGLGITIGENSRVYRFSCLKAQSGSIVLGKNCTLQPGCFLGGAGGIEIGDNVRIAPGVKMFSYDHNFSNREIPIYEQGIVLGKIIVENNVWIGSDAILTKGVKIGEGSVVAAGSVITRDVPRYTIVAGTPARVIRNR